MLIAYLAGQSKLISQVKNPLSAGISPPPVSRKRKLLGAYDVGAKPTTVWELFSSFECLANRVKGSRVKALLTEWVITLGFLSTSPSILSRYSHLQ